MSGYLTSSSLINQIKLEGMIPSSQQTFTDNDFLSIANQELKISMLPSIMVYHEEYYVRDSDSITLVENQSRYPIPYRAVGGKFRELFYQDTNGNLRKMSRISPDERPYYQQSNFQNNFLFFFIEGNDIVITPSIGVTPSGSIIFSYFLRPNDLVSESRVGTITNIATDTLLNTTTFTLDVIPQNLTSFVQDGVTLTGFSTSAKLDILQRRPGHATINLDIQCMAIDTVNKTITFDSDDVGSSIIPGDYIAFAGECIIPQLPSDLHEVLVQRVIQRITQALGDTAAFQASSAKLAEMERNTGRLVDNRSEGSAQKAANLNGLMRSSKIGRRWWY